MGFHLGLLWVTVVGDSVSVSWQFFSYRRFDEVCRLWRVRFSEFVRIPTGQESQILLVGAIAVCGGLVPTLAAAAETEPVVVGEQVQQVLPPPDSPALFTTLELRFPNQGNVSSVDGQTYLYYMEIDDFVSLPSQGRWTPFDESIERVLLDDFERLWGTGFLTDLAIEIIDDPYPNGVEGKRALFLMEERERVRIVTFEGSDEVKRTDIEEALQLTGVELRLDSRIGPGVIRRAEAVVRQMFLEKGYQFAEITHEITPVAGGPKVVQLTFNMDQGPKVHIDDISFVGNDQMSERSLKRRMKNTKERWFLSFISGRGTYKPFAYEEDAEALEEHYRNNGYIEAQVGQPELDYLEISEDGESRPVTLRIPVSEGERYRVGTVQFEGQTVMRLPYLEETFSDLRPGRHYSEKDVRDAFDEIREAYGSIGYYEMTAFPELAPRTEPHPEGLPTRIDGEPVVDVTIHFQEGAQYFVNRITFVGNKTTHDEVIRREINLVERGIFDTEALQYSVRRINQLGYFEPLEEQSAIEVEKRPGYENEVDLTLRLEESNLNQLTFGAGMSQFDGFFVQVAFQTTNFLGRGESLTLSVMNGERMKNYNIGFTEPFLFGRPITGSVDLYRRDIHWINSFTQSSLGGSTGLGLRTGQWSQLFLSYSYEETVVSELHPYFRNPNFLRFNPYLQDSLLLGQGGVRIISMITPTFQFNTVDHPIFPTTGSKYIAGIELAGLGGNTSFYKPILEGIWYLKHAERLSFGFRARGEYIVPYGKTAEIGAGVRGGGLPIFSLLTMGGDFSLRGFDIRSIGPSDDYTKLVIGGNKSLLFNAEYLISIADPVRLIFFYDAGQVADFGQRFSRDLFRTSTGAEVRFFMPVLNVPFRLIYAFNPQRGDALNDRFQPQEASVFKFSVGTTF